MTELLDRPASYDGPKPRTSHEKAQATPTEITTLDSVGEDDVIPNDIAQIVERVKNSPNYVPIKDLQSRLGTLAGMGYAYGVKLNAYDEFGTHDKAIRKKLINEFTLNNSSILYTVALTSIYEAYSGGAFQALKDNRAEIKSRQSSNKPRPS